MGKNIHGEFNPDFAVPPGETLLEVIGSLGMSQAELAERTQRSKKMINEIIKGKAPITSETAIQFERVLGVPARFWMNLEYNYREILARLEEQQRLELQMEWLANIPFKHMIKLGWIDKASSTVQQFREVLNFFSVASVDSWKTVWKDLLDKSERCTQVAFRHTSAFKSNPGSLITWLRKGEKDAQEVVCRPYDASGFRKVLQDIKGLTNEEPNIFIPKMVQMCSEVGVAVVFVRELPGCRANGATRWLKDKAIIQLSLRYKADDHLWFTFYHEAGHILHDKKVLFVEGDGSHEEAEERANKFASEFLVPHSQLDRFIRNGDFTLGAVNKFAQNIGIAPGILVGRLQFDGVLPFKTSLNKLKRHLTWSEE